MLLNKANKYYFWPETKTDNVEIFEVVEEFKLIGVIITSNLKWNMNTKHITQKLFQILWMLRRLKQLGASQTEFKEVRIILEFAAVVWHPGRTKEKTAQIKSVQKSAFAIILG